MPDPVATRCPDCQSKIRINNSELIGRKVKCPKCKEPFVVRPLEASPAPKASPAPAAAAASGAANEAPPTAEPQNSAPTGSEPSLVSWEVGIGDDKKYHIAHVTPEGITLVLKMKDYKEWVDVVSEANSSLSTAAATLQELPKGQHLSVDEISKATYAPDLNQLTIFHGDGKKVKVPEGKEQADLFAAINQHLGGEESEEDADAWSVMQTPLFVLSVIGVIGGFFIWFTTICEPDFEATGRRSGMKQLLNTIGYKIGPMWMSIGVGSLAALVLGLMIFQLIKRPTRQVLEFGN